MSPALRCQPTTLARPLPWALATLLLLGGCGGDPPVTGGPDTPVIDTGSDLGLDIRFDVPPDAGGGDIADDVGDDISADAADDTGDDGGGRDLDDDAIGVDLGPDDVLDDRGGLDVDDDAPFLDIGVEDVAVDLIPDAVDGGTDAGPDAVDMVVLLGLGEPCEGSEQCESNRCESFGDERICTASCDASCPVDGLVCFDGLCTPEDYCGSDGDGRPVGPGCPCDGLCDENATCEALDDVTEICECNPGYDGDGFTCTLRDLPWLRVSPESVDFGPVGLFSSAFETITITNVGPEPRLVTDLRLARRPSQGFELFPPFALPLELAPETAATFDVRFRPTVLISIETEYVNEIEIVSDDPEIPLHTIPIEGIGVPAQDNCLTFDQSVVDFGVIEGGEVDTETVTLTNCGSTPLAVDVIELFGDTETFSIDVDAELPVALGGDTAVDVEITYAPESPDPAQAVLRASSTGGVEAAVRVQGGYTCPFADFEVEGGDLNLNAQNRIIGRDGELWTFDAQSSDDPAGGDLEYEWEVLAPDGSGDLDITPDLSSEAFAMVPDVAGRYIVSLRVISEESGLASCNRPIIIMDAFPSDPVVVIEVTWNNQADVDLHLVQSNEDGFPEFGGGGAIQPFDAYFNNLFADFGVIDDPVDNAWHQGDDTDGLGPESIELGRLREGRRYRVGVNYARRLGTTSVTPTLTVTVGDQDAVSFSTTLTETNFWTPVIIEDDGSLTVLGIGDGG